MGQKRAKSPGLTGIEKIIFEAGKAGAKAGRLAAIEAQQHYLSTIGRKGGRARSAAKVAAGRRNLRKARAAKKVTR